VCSESMAHRTCRNRGPSFYCGLVSAALYGKPSNGAFKVDPEFPGRESRGRRPGAKAAAFFSDLGQARGTVLQGMGWERTLKRREKPKPTVNQRPHLIALYPENSDFRPYTTPRGPWPKGGREGSTIERAYSQSPKLGGHRMGVRGRKLLSTFLCTAYSNGKTQA